MNTAIKTKSLKAKRFINTKDLTRKDWLDARKQGIGSSDASSACGINPYQSMLELWMIKTGRLHVEAGDVMNNPYSPLYWGHQLEPIIANYYSQNTGNKVRRVNAILQHPEHDFMMANLDYEVVKSDEVQILECKSTGQYGTKLWRNGVPLYVICQVQHQLAVTGKQSAHVCVLLAGHEAKIFKVTRDDKLIAHIIKEEQQFWDYVQTDTPPPADASESSAKALQQLYPTNTPNKIADFKDNESVSHLFNRYLKVQQQLDYHQKHHDELKHKLQAHIQNAEKAIFNNGSISWKKSKDSISLDTKALLAQKPKLHAELLKRYPKTKKGSRRFMVYTD